MYDHPEPPDSPLFIKGLKDTYRFEINGRVTVVIRAVHHPWREVIGRTADSLLRETGEASRADEWLRWIKQSPLIEQQPPVFRLVHKKKVNQVFKTDSSSPYVE